MAGTCICLALKKIELNGMTSFIDLGLSTFFMIQLSKTGSKLFTRGELFSLLKNFYNEPFLNGVLAASEKYRHKL